MQLNPLRLIIFGAPGSGKGTQTSRLIKKFPDLKPISSGDILRLQIAKGTPVGTEANEHIRQGNLVPDNTMISLIKNELESHQLLNHKSTWLLDGFPRTANQGLEFNTMLKDYNANINMVVELDVDQDIILSRIEARWVHLPSGRIYNLDYNPPKVPFKDDITGEPLSKREDDKPEVFKRRLSLYNSQIEPLKEVYRQLGVLHTVSGNTSNIIYPKLEKLLIDNFSI